MLDSFFHVRVYFSVTYITYKTPFCQYGLDSENFPILSMKSRNGQQHGASRTTATKPINLKQTNCFHFLLYCIYLPL